MVAEREYRPAPAGRAATGERSRPSRLPLAAICLGYFMVILDVTVVTVAVPVIGTSLHAGVTAVAWVVDGYTVVFGGLLLFCGGLGDRRGARPVFVAGLVIFTLASAGCGAAPAAPVLIGARLVQGAGAAMMVPASLSLLRASYADPAARARAFGVWGMVAGVAAGAGPVLGGVLATALGWRAVFLLNLPIGAAALAMTLRYVPAAGRRPGIRAAARSADTRPGLDLPAQAAAVASLAGLAAGLNEAGSLGWASPVVIGALAACLAGSAAFLVLERRSRAPMLPLEMFRTGAFSASAAVGVLLNVGFYGLLFIAPLYFERVHHYTALRTGLALLPAMGLVAASSAVSGRVAAHTGPRLPIVTGLVVGAAGLLGWLLAGPRVPYVVVAVPMAAAAAGTAFTMPASTAAIMEAAPAERAGAASAVFNAARQAGTAVGVAMFGTLAAGGLVGGLHAGVATGGAAFVAAAVLAAVYIRPGRGSRPARPRESRSA